MIKSSFAGYSKGAILPQCSRAARAAQKNLSMAKITLHPQAFIRTITKDRAGKFEFKLRAVY